MSQDQEIERKEERVNEIIAELKRGELSLAEAKQLRDEGENHLSDLRSILTEGEGEVRTTS